MKTIKKPNNIVNYADLIFDIYVHTHSFPVLGSSLDDYDRFKQWFEERSNQYRKQYKLPKDDLIALDKLYSFCIDQ
jgi:hypothetical protein